jgi:hypothetical protein
VIDPALATAADYADALLTARRTKNVVALLLLLLLLIQLGMFLSLKFWVGPQGIDKLFASTAPTTAPTTSIATSAPPVVDLLQYATSATLLGSLVLSVLLTLVLLLIAHIMLVGRLIGVASVISAVVTSLLLVLILFPWQALLVTQSLSNGNFIFPGVLFSWSELAARAHATPTNTLEQILYWARFVAWPVVAIILILRIQIRSGRGLRQALGEDVSPDYPKAVA